MDVTDACVEGGDGSVMEHISSVLGRGGTRIAVGGYCASSMAYMSRIACMGESVRGGVDEGCREHML